MLQEKSHHISSHLLKNVYAANPDRLQEIISTALGIPQFLKTNNH
jgi:hypothetical protein